MLSDFRSLRIQEIKGITMQGNGALVLVNRDSLRRFIIHLIITAAIGIHALYLRKVFCVIRMKDNFLSLLDGCSAKARRIFSLVLLEIAQTSERSVFQNELYFRYAVKIGCFCLFPILAIGANLSAFRLVTLQGVHILFYTVVVFRPLIKEITEAVKVHTVVPNKDIPGIFV